MNKKLIFIIFFICIPISLSFGKRDKRSERKKNKEKNKTEVIETQSTEEIETTKKENGD